MHVIYLVRHRGKYHTNQSHRILLTHYFFYVSEGVAFWSLAPGSAVGYYATGYAEIPGSLLGQLA